jgi:uncharacterized protein YecE (DUF72 family)
MAMAANPPGTHGLPSACRLYVGTSGYAYTDWVAAGFYPSGTPARGMLAWYARHFPIIELSYTWYQMPRPETIERERRCAPPKFLFTAKLPRVLTHEIDPDRWPRQVLDFRDGVTPLIQSAQLAAVLIQLPPSFDRTPAHRRHLAALLDALHDLPLAVEFRHGSWVNDRVLAELERRRVTLVTVDGPPLPALFPFFDAVTNPDFFYVRFYGRNLRGWRANKPQQQFDYDYSEAELRHWTETHLTALGARARRGLLFFANHIGARAAGNAQKLIGLLEEKGMTSR